MKESKRERERESEREGKKVERKRVLNAMAYAIAIVFVSQVK